MRNYFREVNRYIKDNFLKSFVILFVAYILISIVSYWVVVSLPDANIKELKIQMYNIFNADDIMTKQGLGLFWGIFVNNLRVAGVNVISFIIPFLFYPVYNIAVNGVISGIVFGVLTRSGVENLFEMFLKLVLPHAIFEIPVIVLSAAMGLRYGILLIKKLFGKAKDQSFRYHFEKLSEILCLYIIPFLLLAAFLEGIVEPWLFGV